MEVKNSLKKIRKARRYSQAEIAELLQTTQQQYSKYETGKQAIPVIHIIKLCEFYKISANKLLGIECFMTENETKNKFYKMYEKAREIIKHAEYFEHISEDAANILLENLQEGKEEIENE